MSGFNRLKIVFGGKVCVYQKGKVVGFGELENTHAIGEVITDENPVNEVELIFDNVESVDVVIRALNRVRKNIAKESNITP